VVHCNKVCRKCLNYKRLAHIIPDNSLVRIQMHPFLVEWWLDTDSPVALSM
jgi:hypothetical protein